MLRLLGMGGIASDHGRNDSNKHNKENNMSAANPQRPQCSPDGVVASSPNPEQTPDGSTDEASPLSPRRINFANQEESTAASRNNNDARNISRQPPSRNNNDSRPYLECLDGANISYGLNENHVLQEENEDKGDGDSCASVDDFEEIDDTAEDAIRERLFLLVNEPLDPVLDGQKNGIILQKGLGPEISIPKIPDDYKPKPVNAVSGEPLFKELDNPGRWSQFTFRPEFDSKKKDAKYTQHSLPTGAIPVPLKNGKREVNGWQFHYENWEHDSVNDISFRSGTKSSDMFPESRKGSQKVQVFAKLLTIP
jgi:hypothetical protein